MTGWLKVLLELGPLAVFFVVFTLLSPDSAPIDAASPAPAAQSVEAVEGAAPPPPADAARLEIEQEALRLDAEIDALIWATVAFMISLFISLGITYAVERTLSRIAILTAIIVLVTGALTVYLRDGIFIKMKPTIAYGAFALGLFIGLARGRSYLKDLMGELAEMTDTGWLKLARNWALFFVFCAALNEFIWRLFDTETWVWTKTFVYLPLILIFTISQAPMMAAHAPPQKGEA